MTPKTWIAIALVTGLVGCSNVVDPPVPEGFTVVEGRVVYASIEGGCWLLQATNDMAYLGVPTEQQVNNLRVRAALRVRSDWGTYCPGVPSEIAWIRALP